MDEAVRQWARRVAALHPDVLRVGYFGSYGRGDWGPGSDVDLLVVVRSPDEPFERRGTPLDATGLPVPADVLVYTEAEWRDLDPTSRRYRMVSQEPIWVLGG